MRKKFKAFLTKAASGKDNTILWALGIIIFLLGALWVTMGIMGLFNIQ